MSTTFSVSATDPREDCDTERAKVVAEHLATVAAISRMVDQLSDLHADMGPDARLHEVLHQLGFVWEHVEAELHVAAHRGKN